MFFLFEPDSGVAVLDRPTTPAVRIDYQKQFIDVFKRLCQREQSWRAWSDFVEMAACAYSNSVDAVNYEARERQYLNIVKRYDGKDAAEFPRLLAILTQALDADPEQDFLGQLFMSLELGNHWRGQFFTPYSLCRAMAEMQTGDLADQLEHKGYVSVNDPACGAGATLIAFANVARSRGVNYQERVLFVAQDIDRTAALMCYLQLSLLGCAGYVVIGDTLANPGIPAGNEVWYTPMWFSKVWHWRRIFQGLKG